MLSFDVQKLLAWLNIFNGQIVITRKYQESEFLDFFFNVVFDTMSEFELYHFHLC